MGGEEMKRTVLFPEVLLADIFARASPGFHLESARESGG